MRTAISGAAGIAALLFAATTAAQGDKPEPLPVLPTIPGPQRAQPVVSSGAPPASASAQPVTPPPKPTPPAPPGPTAPPKPRAPGHPDAPPPPPPAGLGPPPPAAIAAPIFSLGASSQQALKEPALAGWHGSFFLRDPSDYIRLYPQGRLQLDFHSFPGAPAGDATNGGPGLQPRFFARRLRIELSGQAFQRWTFTFGADFGGQSLPNANGRTEATSPLPGGDPAQGPARYVPNEGVNAGAVIANAFVNYSICPCLNLMVGQHQAPFGLENRTSNNVTSFMERNLPIRGFVVPNGKEMGLTVWGDLFDGRLSYELGVYSGDGQNRPQVDNNPDFIGRIFTRPLFGTKSSLAKLQLGVSGHRGQRDQKLVAYDYPAITTGQGFSLWDPRYRDALGRAVHVIPSGAQNAIGGEFRLPLSQIELRGEAYYVSNDTREAIEGYQLASTERLGRMAGVGWYVQASAWPYGDAFVNGDPGFSRPVTMSFATEVEKPKKGIEIVVLAGGVNAQYQGNSRGGTADASTPTAATGSKIDVFQYGLGLNYWYSNHLRVSANYTIYHTPGSGSAARNLATVPANLGETQSRDEHLLHELGTRVAIWF